MTDPLTILALGLPRPMGSKRLVGGTRRPRMIDVGSADLRRWQETIQLACHEAMTLSSWTTLEVPVVARFDFTMATPQRLEPRIRRAPHLPQPAATMPDIDKLVRAAADALTGRAYLDDRLITKLTATKRYAGSHAALPTPGVMIQVKPWTP